MTTVQQLQQIVAKHKFINDRVREVAKLGLTTRVLASPVTRGETFRIGDSHYFQLGHPWGKYNFAVCVKL